MKNLLLILPIIATLTACVAIDGTGKTIPVVIQTPSEKTVVNPVIIDNRTVLKPEQKTDPNAPIYVCSIKPFMETYKSENVSRAKAKLDTQKKCLAKNDEMFCSMNDIECSEIK